ncbi:MAG: hypothetical protein JWP27_2505 [Flaviaesturariibacter sp.]|nr:hypothetical protein [Flaviaesturariibacter sp.]
MLKSLLRDRKLLILLVLAVLVKLFSLSERSVERYYTYGVYPVISRLLRALFGWIPISIGDLFYIGAAVFLIVKTARLVRLLARRKIGDSVSWVLFRKYLRLVLWIYLVFNCFWGLNYNRLGIASQLGLDVRPYTRTELFTVTRLVQARLNECAALVDTAARARFDRLSVLAREGQDNYARIAQDYPFLRYPPASIKASVFSRIGHYFGFSGYFNPFTGEAQMNVAEPLFLQPFVVNHEMAHQLGYGKENEASFVSYLACKQSASIDFRYSVYYELFSNALAECRMMGDTSFTGAVRRDLHPRVRRDKLAEYQYRFRKRNRVSPYVTDFYDQYLRLNNQPKGMATYNEVIAWLIAYVRKYGAEAL